MSKIWSISTTTRNPYRIYSFLFAATFVENQIWDEETQKNYQICLIMLKEYKPKGYEADVAKIPDIIDSATGTFNKDNVIKAYNKATEIFNKVGYKDPAMRGRQSINMLEKMGLVVIDNNHILRITQIGCNLLSGKITLGDVLLNVDFDSISSIDVNPIILTLEFLMILDDKMNGNSNGITICEFEYYVMTISQWFNVDKNVDELIKSRQDKVYAETYKNSIRKQYDNFKHVNDYVDSTIKYFHTSQYISITSTINYNKEKRDDIISIINNYHNKKIQYVNNIQNLYENYRR